MTACEGIYTQEDQDGLEMILGGFEEMECYKIPEKVMFDGKLPAGAKLLYGVITTWAASETVVTISNNESLAKLFNSSKKAVAKWINYLTATGYISAEAVFVSDADELAWNGWEIQVLPLDEEA